ncbi:DUF2249 domain-containing protein [Halobacteriales archaeon Cl-PHB]
MAVQDHVSTALDRLDLPANAPAERLDVADQGPPAPMKETLELLPDLSDDTILVQVNDRAPQHLYPKLEDRGYEYDTHSTDEVVVTAIWCR